MYVPPLVSSFGSSTRTTRFPRMLNGSTPFVS